MIVKLTASKKAIQIIDDDGNVFQTSAEWMRSLLMGNKQLVLCNRMPFSVSPTRYKPSPIYNPDTGLSTPVVIDRGGVKPSEDLHGQFKKEKSVRKRTNIEWS